LAKDGVPEVILTIQGYGDEAGDEEGEGDGVGIDVEFVDQCGGTDIGEDGWWVIEGAGLLKRVHDINLENIVVHVEGGDVDGKKGVVSGMMKGMMKGMGMKRFFKYGVKDQYVVVGVVHNDRIALGHGEWWELCRGFEGG
jgi:hypothetical protein